MTVHLVAEELRRRGREVDHLHSWDDFDRLRKVPAGVPESFAEHIGRPLADVPDPEGAYPSYADRHISEFTEALGSDRSGGSGDSTGRGLPGRCLPRGDQARHGSDRGDIFDILAEYQTAGRPRGERRGAPGRVLPVPRLLPLVRT